MMTEKSMVEKYQCPGCVCGSDTTCGQYHWNESMNRCTGHVLGTVILGCGPIALGLPRGFCRPGNQGSNMFIRLWAEGHPEWDKLNVPVWAMEHEGALFVRTYLPRVNVSFVDVIEGGNWSMLGGWHTINVAEFYDEID